MKFKIEQLAFYTKDIIKARILLGTLSTGSWIKDVVTAEFVSEENKTNKAELNFNYGLSPEDSKPLEIELIRYVEGDNYLSGVQSPAVAHIAMHVDTWEELMQWDKFLSDMKIKCIQDVVTKEHSEEFTAKYPNRKYRYMIFDARDIIGICLKFILRLETKDAE